MKNSNGSSTVAPSHWSLIFKLLSLERILAYVTISPPLVFQWLGNRAFGQEAEADQEDGLRPYWPYAQMRLDFSQCRRNSYTCPLGKKKNRKMMGKLSQLLVGGCRHLLVCGDPMKLRAYDSSPVSYPQVQTTTTDDFDLQPSSN